MTRSVFWTMALRLGLGLGLTGAAVWFALRSEWVVACIAAAGALVAAATVAALFAKQLRKNTFLFEAIENEDFAFRFDEQWGGTLERRHHRALNRMRRAMETILQKSREQEAYYGKILDHSATGVLVVDPTTGIVFQSNRAARELLGVDPLTHVEALGVVAGELPSALRTVEPGRSQTVGYYTERQRVELTLSASWVDLHDKPLKIVALNDIGASIDNTRTESWAQLSRVLAHEIMNSLAPITSLSEQLLQTDDPQLVHRGLEVIRTTSRGLVGFVESYRKLTRLPQPVVRKIEVGPWLEQTVGLFDRPIEVRCADPAAVLYADADQVAQVVTNLLKNAVEACTDEAIWVEVLTVEGRTAIEVGNLGPEIDPKVREEMFVPFFTTKSSGSGIGLSLSRQVMRLHGGGLVHSTRTLAGGERATVFALHF